jgi:hypothetical protein
MAPLRAKPAKEELIPADGVLKMDECKDRYRWKAMEGERAVPEPAIELMDQDIDKYLVGQGRRAVGVESS